ncbi:MAG: bifunctional UDP-N-acetylglucosamine diphosphorylase/glucosamine-1-phosphate N-acetyltransferase GlmU [Legionellaceae bacterium]
MSLHVVILAAGQGKRMHSALPKVLHPVGGKPMLERVVDAAKALSPEAIHVVIGHQGDDIQAALSGLPVHWVFQSEQLGTGHAVMQALSSIPASSHVLVLSGDVPLIKTQTLKALVQKATDYDNVSLVLLSALLDDPTGLGRLIRDDRGDIVAIVEEKDANEHQRRIAEVYTGTCVARAADFSRWLPALSSNNAQGEYYLTDIIAMAAAESGRIVSFEVPDVLEVQGVNHRIQLQQVERALQLRLADQLMEAGVTLADASRLDVRGELQCGRDVFIDVNVVFKGRVVLGDHVSIGPNCEITDVSIAAGTHVYANSVLEASEIGPECSVGPFARLRPGTVLGARCKLGNFVETKNAVFDVGSKANHLTYLGDVTIGKAVNIGAGTITCNYDGANKHQTVIEDGVFIGSDTQLVAPVTIGQHATIGAGSTIRKSVPAHELTLTESKQKTVQGWIRPKKNIDL